MKRGFKSASEGPLQSGITDAASIENALLDECGLFGRRNDLKALLKWLNLARVGQTKTVLLTGDEGIGKTRLLQTLQDICLEGNYGRVLDLRGIYHVSAERLYCHLLDSLKALSEELLEDALLQINETPQQLEMNWSRTDLVEAMQLVKHQEFRTKHVDLSQQELVVRKIRSSISVTRKLKSDITPDLELVVGILTDPWLSVAHGILSQTNPSVEKAYRHLENLKPQLLIKENVVARALSELLEEVQQEDVLSSDALEEGASEYDADAEGQEASVVDTTGLVPTLAVAEAKLVTPSTAKVLEPSPVVKEAKDQQETMVRHLTKVFQFINTLLRNSDRALLILLDDWQDVAVLPEGEREGLKQFFAAWLKELTDGNNFNLMICLATRPEGQSYSLGGGLYGSFFQKLLLSPLPEMAFKKLLVDPLKQSGVQLSAELTEELFTISRGNPFWLIQCRRFIEDWAQVTERQDMALSDFKEMGVQSLQDFLELGFTRLKLQFMHQEDRFLDCLDRLLQEFERRPFLVQDVIQLLDDTPSFPQQFIFDVLRGLYRNHFINEVAVRGYHEDPIYMFDSRIVVAFLRQKQSEIQPKVTPQDQLHFLKQVIPLSLRSGELSREKTQELIAMNRVLGNSEMTEFLEGVFASYLEDPNPAVRSSALSNLSAIPSGTTMDRILACLEDWDESVRVCALENLSLLMDFQGIGQGVVTQEMLNRIWAALSLRTTDESVAIRSLAYQTLGKLHWYADAVGLLVQGTEDDEAVVRCCALEALLKVDPLTEEAAPAIVSLLRDPDESVRVLACKGMARLLEQSPDGDWVAQLPEFLVAESEESVKVAFIQALSGRLTVPLIQSLQKIFETQSTERLQVAILRSFSRTQGLGAQLIEPFLTQLIRKHHTYPVTVVWAAVKALAEVAEQSESLDALRQLKTQVTSDILLVAIDSSLRRIQGRLHQFRLTLDHQLKRSSTATSAANKARRGATPESAEETAVTSEPAPLKSPPADAIDITAIAEEETVDDMAAVTSATISDL